MHLLNKWQKELLEFSGEFQRYRGMSTQIGYYTPCDFCNKKANLRTPWHVKMGNRNHTITKFACSPLHNVIILPSSFNFHAS